MNFFRALLLSLGSVIESRMTPISDFNGDATLQRFSSLEDPKTSRQRLGKRMRSRSDDESELRPRKLHHLPVPADMTRLLTGFNALGTSLLGRSSCSLTNNRHLNPSPSSQYSRPSASLISLPNELCITIFGYLSGEWTDFYSLILTCRHFNSVLKLHGHVIVNGIFRRTALTERIILCNLAKIKGEVVAFGVAWSQPCDELGDRSGSLPPGACRSAAR
jgi:F-box-like